MRNIYNTLILENLMFNYL